MSKKHKFYFRAEGDELRNLENISPKIVQFITTSFIKNGAQKEYEELNKDVRHWNEYKPITMQLPPELHTEFEKIQYVVDHFCKATSITISYNGSWKPLVELTK